ncbi:MAG TPA: YhcN/YlaJ family sporulation lipoprotein [Cerasibacillus sp.]|uniref:YhcN/YlaJ family sporulation lipoprotein n=1 Tax=Cerasibacillus sp. TaxID=2498711 RepID=UPI002F41A6C2
MQKIIMTIFLTSFVLFGCDNGDQRLGEREHLNNQLDPNSTQTVDPDFDKRIGFVNYKRNQIENESQRQMTVDRFALADMITRLLLQNKAFEEVATVVTGNEVLIAYEKHDDFDEKETIEYARKTAMSVMPRYFDIHVSDNPNLIDDLQSLHNSLTTDKNYQNVVDQIIHEMNQGE